MGAGPALARPGGSAASGWRAGLCGEGGLWAPRAPASAPPRCDSKGHARSWRENVRFPNESALSVPFQVRGVGCLGFFMEESWVGEAGRGRPGFYVENGATSS